MSEQLISKGDVKAHLIAEWEGNIRTNEERAEQSPAIAGIFTDLVKQDRAQLELLLQGDFEFDVEIHPAVDEDNETLIDRATINYQIGQTSGVSHMDLPAEDAVVSH